MKKRTVAEFAGICGVRFLNSMAIEARRLPEFAKNGVENYSKAIAGEIPWEAWRERITAGVGVATDALAALGFRPWSDEGDSELWLAPFWLVPFIPDGFPVVSIDGERCEWKRSEIDDDIRFGVIAYGIEVPRPQEGDNNANE